MYKIVAIDGRAPSSQLVGRVGEQVTLLCMGDTRVQSAAWTGNTSSNITFTHLHSTNAGVYTCRGTTVNSKVVSHSVNLTVSGELCINEHNFHDNVKHRPVIYIYIYIASV